MQKKFSTIDAEIQKIIHGSGTATLIISHEEMNDTMTSAQALENSNILLKGITKAIENEKKISKRTIFMNVIRYFRS